MPQGLPARIICILGMHRSGTSCLTGSLQEAGLQLGDCHTWNPFNRKGNRENQAFVDLHDEIMAANGGSWDHPPKRVAWSPEQEARALDLLHSHQHLPLMGFKDPRTLLLLEGWRRIAPTLELVGIFRHPAAVAASLENRNGMHHRQALRLWYEYNRRLLQAWRERPFPLLCFDHPQEDFQRQLQRAIALLGLRQPTGELLFYDDELKTHDHRPGARLPLRVALLYRRLRGITV